MMKKNTLIMIVFATVLASCSGSTSIENEQETPIIEETSPADVLANKMLKAINKEAWDKINFVQWSFRGKRHFVWDKKAHLVEVKWDENRILINPNTSKGIAYQKNQLVKGESSDQLIKRAIDAFNNDSFWLNAPAKVYDYGTERSVVSHEGKDALMVKYTTGGTTPGDSYLWILDENNLPVAWKMWVNGATIEEEGIELTWEEWKKFDGIKLSEYHKAEEFDLRISNINTGMLLTDLEITEDIFAELR